MNATREALHAFVDAAGDLLAAMHAIAADAQAERAARGEDPAAGGYEDIDVTARRAIARFKEAIAPCFTQGGEAPDALLLAEANVEPLLDALRLMDEDSREATGVLAPVLGDQSEEEALRKLRLASEVARCLARLLPGRTIKEVHAAFGAPGSFGYETPIGDALARAYGLKGGAR